MIAALAKPLSVFYCYAHEDEALRDELDKHLKALKLLGWIESWHDRDIRAGIEWQREIDTHLRNADLILLLVSADFLNSEYCYSIELQEALRKHQTGEAVVIPVILRPVNWQDTPLGTLQALPIDGIPVTSWPNHDAALVEIASGIQSAVKALLKLVYIASSPADDIITQQIVHDLKKQGLTPWSRDHITLSSSYQDNMIRQMIRASHAILLITSPHARYARSIREELRIAAMYQQYVVPVWVAGETWQEVLPTEVREIPVVDAREHRYENAFQEIIDRLRHQVSTLAISQLMPVKPLQVLEEPRNPFKGLHAFHAEDSYDFFGRDELIHELVDALQTIANASIRKQHARLLAIVGPSGSGKSSVAMAGLLPSMQRGAVVDSDQWLYLSPMLPGVHPLEALALVLAKKLSERSIVSIQEDLMADSARGLHQLTSQMITQSETKVVLLVDQFEELFTMTTSEEERRHFIDLLIMAVTEPRGPVILLLTLRADFYEHLTSYPELARLLQESHRLVLPMTLRDTRSVIEGPAALPDVDLSFEGDLVGDLLFEVQGQGGALPLLQFTLDQLFRRRSGHLLTLVGYHEIGGVKGALTLHAETTYVSLPTEEHRLLAQFLFLHLVDPETIEQETTKRRAAISEFALPDPKRTLVLREVVDIFIGARLLMANTVAGVPMVEISHETLIHEWIRLAEWLHLSRDDISLQKIISRDAAEWMRRGKPTERLYWGTELTEAQQWAERNLPTSNEITFLQASANFWETRQAQQERLEEDRAREMALQRRTTRRQRFVISAMSVMAIVLTASLIFLTLQQWLAPKPHVPITSTGTAMRSDLCPTITSAGIFGTEGNCAFFMSSGQVDPTGSQGIANQLQINLQNISSPHVGKEYYAWLLGDINPPQFDDLSPPLIHSPILLGKLSIDHGSVHYNYPGDAQGNNLLSATSRLLISEESSREIPKVPSTDHTAWRYYAELPNAQISGDAPGFSTLSHLRSLIYNSTRLRVLGHSGGLNNWMFRNIERVLGAASIAKDAAGPGADVASIRNQVVLILGFLDGAEYVQRDLPPGTFLPGSYDFRNLSLLTIDPNWAEKIDTVPLINDTSVVLSNIAMASDITQNQRNLLAQMLSVLDHIMVWLNNVHNDAVKLVHMTNVQLSSLHAQSILNDMETQARYAYSGSIGGDSPQGTTWLYNSMLYLATFNLQMVKQ